MTKDSEQIQLPPGWTLCKSCGNPVPPLAENLTGFGEVYPDQNPYCEECISQCIEIEVEEDKLPF